MKYFLEFIDEDTSHGYETASTIEADSYIPIPAVGEEIESLPGASFVIVVSRRFFYGNGNVGDKKQPYVKVQITCREKRAPAASYDIQ
jgi:hypothetical protein